VFNIVRVNIILNIVVLHLDPTDHWFNVTDRVYDYVCSLRVRVRIEGFSFLYYSKIFYPILYCCSYIHFFIQCFVVCGSWLIDPLVYC